MTLLSPSWCRAAPEGHVHRVLVAEDEAAIRELLAEFLRLEGYAVAACPNGATALEEARRDPPCLALVDLMMPDVDGPLLIAACRADAGLRELPIVVVTAALGEPAVERLTVQGFVPKPFDLHRLLATVVAAIGGAEPEETHPLARRVTFQRPPV